MKKICAYLFPLQNKLRLGIEKKTFGFFFSLLSPCTIFAAALTLIGAVLTACDEGDIYNETHISSQGRPAKLTAKLTGLTNWTGNYNVVLAGFDAESEYSDIQVSLSKTLEGKDTCIVMEGVPSDVSTLELCVVNTLRQRVLTLASVDVQEGSDTIRLDAGTIDVGMFSAIQRGVFTADCVMCHGASNSAAADLYLTEGNSHASLVNHASTRVTDGIRVIPGDSANSVLHKVINPGNEAGLSFSHENIITSSRVLKLIDVWIENGAAE